MGVAVIIGLEINAAFAGLLFSGCIVTGLALLLQDHFAVRLKAQDICRS